MDNKKLDEINISQKPAIEVLENLGYTYIDTQEAEIMRGNLYNVLLKPIIKSKLEELNYYTYKGKEYKFNEKNINKAINDLDE